MKDAYIISEFLFTGVSAGLIGTVVMSYFLVSVSRLPIMQIGLVSAIGSVFTDSMHAAKKLGWYIHFTAGLSFGLLYSLLLTFADVNLVYLNVPLGGAIGIVHGFTLFFLLVPTLAEHHRFEQVRDVGGAMALAYFFAHIMFGLAVGTVFTWFQVA